MLVNYINSECYSYVISLSYFLVHYFFRAVVNHAALVDGTTNSIVKLKTPSQVT